MITVFTLAGTGHPGAAGAVDDGKGGFPAQVADLLDKSRVTVVPVAYPATVPFYSSVDAGVAALSGLISAETDDFALLAYSQGAMVASAVYDRLRAGSPRLDQLRAAVMMGNPRREAGRLFPGGTPVSGHGIQNAATRLVGTEDRWWEMSIPGCIASAVGDGPDDQVLTQVFMSLAQPPKGILAGIIAARNLLTLGPKLIPGLLGASQYVNGFPHGQYGVHTPIAGDARTCVQVAADHINALA